MSTQQPDSKFALRIPSWVTIGAYMLFIRPQILKWGTELGESQRRLPGDELIPDPNFQVTHALNIDAPPEAVWPWLAQMGREHTGYYGLDLLTNAGIPSVTFLRKDLPDPEVNMPMDGGYHIAELEPNRKLLFAGFNLIRQPNITLDSSTLYLLERRRDGSTRLLVRSRMFAYGFSGTIFARLYEPVYFMFAKQQFDNLKHHAESMAHIQA